MNVPKIRIDEKYYKFICYREFRYGYEIKIQPYGEIVLPTKSKKKALSVAKETFSNVLITRVELKSIKTITYVLSQKNADIVDIVKKYGEVIESEVYL